MNSQFNMLSLKGYDMIHPTEWFKKSDITKDMPKLDLQDRTVLFKFTSDCFRYSDCYFSFWPDALPLKAKYLFVYTKWLNDLSLWTQSYRCVVLTQTLKKQLVVTAGM